MLEAHSGYVFDVAFNQQGTLLASGSGDRSIRLWDTRIWQSIGVLEGHTGSVLQVLFSPDGRYLASADGVRDAPGFRVWDIVTQQVVRNYELGEPITSMSFSADSRYLAFMNTEEIHLLDLATGVSSSFPHDPAYVSHWALTAFDANGTLIVGQSLQAKAIWTIEEGRAVSSYVGQVNKAMGGYLGDISQDDFAYLRRGIDSTIARAWAEIAARSAYNHSYGAETIPSPNGQYALLKRHRRWEIWDINAPTALTLLHNNVNSLEEAHFVADEAGVAAASRNATYLWYFDDPQQVSYNFELIGYRAPHILALRDQPHAVLMDTTDRIRLLDLTSGEDHQIAETVNTYDLYAFSEDGHYLAATRRDRSTTIWDLETGEILSHFLPDDPGARYWALAFSPNNHLLAVSVQDRECSCSQIELRDIVTGERVVVLGHVMRYAQSGTFSPDGALLVVGAGGHTPDNSGGSITVWSLETGQEIGFFDGPRLSVSELAISQSGRYVTAIAFGEVWLWDIQAKAADAVRIALSPGNGEADYLTAALNPSGVLLAVGTNQGDILIFDVANGKQLVILKQHKSAVQDIAFSIDDRSMISTGSDGTLRLWRVDAVSPLRSSALAPLAVSSVTPTPFATPSLPPSPPPPNFG